MKVFDDCVEIAINQIRSIAAFWVYLKDTPKSFRKSFKNLFNEPAPK